jgi:hypothetical protein
MRDTALMEVALGLTRPWTVTGSDFDAQAGRIDIQIDFPAGSRFACPVCNAAGCTLHDTERKFWRHLNFFQHQTYRNRRVPRARSEECGIRSVGVADWDNVLGRVDTVKLKDATASRSLRGLNSYSRPHSFYNGLTAFRQVTNSILVLRYIGEVGLRIAIEILLNSIELGNRFTRAISVGNPSEFTETRVSLLTVIRRSRRPPKPQTGSSRTPSYAGTTLLLEQRLNQAPTKPHTTAIGAAVANHSVISRGMSTFLEDTTSPTRSSRFQSASPPQKTPEIVGSNSGADLKQPRLPAVLWVKPCHFTSLCITGPFMPPSSFPSPPLRPTPRRRHPSPPAPTK